MNKEEEAEHKRHENNPKFFGKHPTAKYALHEKKEHVAKKMSPEFVNEWRNRHGSNEGLDSPSANRAYKEHLRRKKIEKKY